MILPRLEAHALPLIDPDRWRYLEPLLDEALDLPPEARTAFLDQLRARSPDDADALVSLLGETMTSWLGTRHRAQYIADVVPQLAAPAQGRLLGPWRLERSLGQGGMGTVWLATRADGLFTGQVAVKLLHPSLIAGESAVLFRREADVLARLTHPAIARLYDAGVTTEGQPYLVLEYIDGQPLDDWYESRRPNQTDRLELLLRICDAVAHAHAHGIVHRDLKPGNLFVTADGDIKLLDFGIAFLVDESRQERQQPYTPRYAAPEQRDGGTVTTATDVYALGLVLGELLGLPVGQRTEEAAPPATSTPVAADLLAIVRRATEPEPAARYPTVAALGDEVRRFLRHEPVVALRGGIGYRARLFARRHAVGLVAVAVVATSLIAGTMISVQQARVARQQRDLALLAERRARTVSEVMLSLMTELPSVDADVRAVRALQRARRLLDAYLGDDRTERARLAIELARQFSLFSRREEARGLLDDATRDATALGDSLLRAEAACQVSLTGDTRTTTTIAVDVDSLRARLPREAWRAHATCAMAQSQQLVTKMQGELADAVADSAVRLAELAGDTVSLFYATLLLDRLQTIGWSKGDFHRKMNQYQRAARGLESLGLALTVPALRVASEAATYSSGMGRLQVADSATAAVREYLEEGERWRAVTPRLAIDLAMVAQGLARPDEAQRWYERSLRQTSASTNEPIAVRVRQQYARFLGESGNVRAATVQLDTLRMMLARASNSAFEAARLRTEVIVQAAGGDARRAWTRLDSLIRSRGFPGEMRLIEWPDALAEYAHLSYQLRRYDEARLAIARVRARFADDTVLGNGSLRLASLQLLEARLQAIAGWPDSAATSASSAERGLRVAVGATHPLTQVAGALRDSLATRTAITPTTTARWRARPPRHGLRVERGPADGPSSLTRTRPPRSRH